MYKFTAVKVNKDNTVLSSKNKVVVEETWLSLF